MSEMEYTELQVTSNFSFLRGASHPHELMKEAAGLGYTQMALTDWNTMAGLVRGHVAARAHGIRLIPGCRLELQDGPALLAYPRDREAYGRLSALLSEGNLRTEKGQCLLFREDVYRHAEGITFIALPPASLNENFRLDPRFERYMEEYKEALGRQVYLGISCSCQGDDQKKFYRLSQLAGRLDMPLAATNDVHYHIPQRRQLQDILCCIREKCTIQTAGFRLFQNAERHLKPPAEMRRLFRHYPQALEHTALIASACSFSLDELEYVYPEELTTEGRSPQEELGMLAWKHAEQRYGRQIPEKIAEALRYELDFIERMNYASYFLTVYDIVRFARERGILCQGRGSAANSTLCYCLGITAVDPLQFKLLFERFISEARNEPPDIDVDFEHERREEVIQYIYEKYGRDRAAIVATVTQLHYKGAVRDVGKAMGLSLDTVARLSRAIRDSGDEGPGEAALREEGLNPRDPHLLKTLELTAQLIGFPRQLGQHTGGFVITQGKLSGLCPILNARMENRTVIEWNKDDIDTLGFLKIDILGLGMLTCIRKAFELLKRHYGLDLNLDTVPKERKEVYDMISKADTLGVFQIESRAQQSMLPRLRPERFYDLVIEVAIVRPGPIQGDMVHPYLRRRNGEEKVEYPSKELEDILDRTLGVPLFQEQAMQVAITGAGFTPSEADELRRSMATFKMTGTVTKFGQKLVEGMVERGYSREFAQRVFKQLEGFGSYGFPESHAASFALLVYVSAWIKCFYPEVFAAALLNSMPMGFYQPAQIVIDAQKHGVEVLPADVSVSEWDYCLERSSGNRHALRLGFRQIKGMREEDAALLIGARKKGIAGMASLCEAGLSLSALEKLADADAFRSWGLDRRRALWEVSALQGRPLALFSGQPEKNEEEASIPLPPMRCSEHVIQDYAATSLSLKAHPLSFLREKLRLLHIMPAGDTGSAEDKQLVKVAGLVLVRQRPGTASGICFITLEDETGFVNAVVFPQLFERYRKEILGARLLMIEGRLQREGEVIHVIAKRCFDLSKLLRELALPADEGEFPFPEKALPENKKKPAGDAVFHEGRNFR